MGRFGNEANCYNLLLTILTLTFGALVGRTTVTGILSCLPWYASATAWLPADAVITPLFFCSWEEVRVRRTTSRVAQAHFLLPPLRERASYTQLYDQSFSTCALFSLKCLFVMPHAYYLTVSSLCLLCNTWLLVCSPSHILMLALLYDLLISTTCLAPGDHACCTVHV